MSVITQETHDELLAEFTRGSQMVTDAVGIMLKALSHPHNPDWAMIDQAIAKMDEGQALNKAQVDRLLGGR